MSGEISIFSLGIQPLAEYCSTLALAECENAASIILWFAKKNTYLSSNIFDRLPASVGLCQKKVESGNVPYFLK